MVEIDVDITGKIKDFVREVEKQNLHIEQVYLFGSYAKGTFDEWSDIDIAVVSNNFCGIRLFDKEKMIKAVAAVDCSLSPLPFRPEDFDDTNLFVKEILETGIRII